MKNSILIIVLALTQMVCAQTTTTTYSPKDMGSQIYTFSNLADDQFTLNWEMAMPYANGYLEETSYSGGRMDYRHFTSESIAVGVSLGWNSYDEYSEKQLYEKEDGSSAIYSDAVRHLYTLPMAVNAYYYIYRQNLRPYLGIGIGAQYSEQTTYFNIYGISESSWGFLVKPEVGLQYEFSDTFGLTAYAAYSYATNQSDAFKIDELTSLGIGVGAYWEW